MSFSVRMGMNLIVFLGPVGLVSGLNDFRDRLPI